MTNKEKIDILIENYKIISDEAKSYLNEILRCFIYFAIVLAIKFGYDGADGQNLKSFPEYMQWAFLCILIYLFSIGFMYVNANRYKAQIEYKINRLAKETLFEFELIYKPKLLKNGFLTYNGKESKRLLPLPNIILCIIILVISLILFWENYNLIFLIIPCISFFLIYIFLFIPRQIEKYQKENKWIR